MFGSDSSTGSWPLTIIVTDLSGYLVQICPGFGTSAAIARSCMKSIGYVASFVTRPSIT